MFREFSNYLGEIRVASLFLTAFTEGKKHGKKGQKISNKFVHVVHILYSYDNFLIYKSKVSCILQFNFLRISLKNHS